MTFSPNVNNVYCPGCAPGDFAQPHICGINPRPSPTITAWPGPAPAALACDHCYCLKQKAGWHNVPAPTVYFPSNTQRVYLKPHQVCCMCGGKRLKP